MGSVSNVSDMSDHTWKRALTMTDKGAVAKDVGNAVLFLLNDQRWAGCLAYNSFADKIFWSKAPPALDMNAKTIFPAPSVGDVVSDRDGAYVHHWFAKLIGVQFARDTILQAIEVAAHNNNVCPPRDYLRSLTWDGVPRLAKMFATYFGADDTVYSSEISQRWMRSAVARIIEPGCKADCLVILQGKQGAKKSSSIAVLGGEWYSNSLPDVTSKDAQISLFGAWIIEIPELEALNKATQSAFKDFSARQFDKFRKPYARFETINQRTCVFIGTTNEDKILSDVTGGRRYWPIKVMPNGGAIDIAGLKRDRDQLWAEAVHQFEQSAIWWVNDALEAIVTAEQDERFADDVWMPTIAKWCDDFEQSGGRDFTLAEVMIRALNIEPARLDVVSSARVGKVLKRLGYDRQGRRRVGEHRFAVYEAKKLGLALSGQRTREPGEDDE